MDMRRSLFFAVFMAVLTFAGLAQNDKISYQAVVRNSANQLVYDQDMEVTVSIANSETGTAVYTETQAVHSNANGLISLLIGDGTPVSGSWDAIQWNHAWVTAVIAQGGTVLATHHLPLSAVPYALYADQVDPAALANYLTTNHYLTEETQVLTISHDTVFLTGGSFVKLPAGFSGNYNDLTNKPDLDQYVTNVHLNDTLGNYLMEESQIIRISNDTIYLTGGSFVKLPAGFSGDYNDLANKPSICDTVASCDVVTTMQTNITDLQNADAALSERITTDSTRLVTAVTNMQNADNALSERITADSTNLLNTTTTLQNADNALSNRITTDSTNLANNYYNKTKINDTVDYVLSQIAGTTGNLNDNYYTKHQVDSIDYTDSLTLANIIRTDSSVLATRIFNDSVTLTARIYNDSLTLAQRMDTIFNHLCDSIEANCTNVALKNADNVFTGENEFEGEAWFEDDVYFDSYVYFAEEVDIDADVIFHGDNYYEGLNDFYEHDAIVLINEAVNQTNLAPVQATATDAINRKQAVNYNDLKFVFDSLNNKIDINNTNACETVSDCVNGWIKDSLNLVRAKIHGDSLTLATTIRTDSTALVNRIVSDSTALADKMHNDSLTLATKIRTDSTALVNRIVADSAALAGKMHADSVALANKMRTDSTALVNRIVADSTALAGKMHSDSLTLSTMIRTDSTALVNRIVSDSTALADKMQGDSLTLATKIRTDSTALVNRIVSDSTALADKMHNDSLTLATKIRTDSTALVNRIVNDSTALHDALIDTAQNIRNSIGNGTLTIKNGESTLGTFQANASQSAEIDVSSALPTVNDNTVAVSLNGNTVGSFTLNQNADATINLDNVAVTTADNAFTGTNTVPSGFVISGDNATNGTNCNNVVVNACDLWAVFDSLTRRIDALQEEVNALKSATPPVFNNLTLSNIRATAMTVTADFTSTGAAITSYEFCYSKNSDMNEAACITNANNSVELTGLDPYTTYYVTAKAINLAGTTSSSVASDRTMANAPTGTFSSDIPAKPLGFKVTVSGLDFKQPGEGTVQLFYKQGSDCTADEDGYTAHTLSETLNTGAEYTQTITGLAASTAYCVMVKVSNVDSITVLGPLNAMSGEAITLDITHTPASLSLCGGSSVDASFEATPSSGDVGDYDYEWSDGTNTVTGNPATITFTSAGDKTITCTASNSVEGYIVTGTYTVTVTDTGAAPSFNECDAGFTVTLSSLEGAVSLNWGNDSADVTDFSDLTKTYTSSGVYTITATSGDGCTKTKQVAVGHATMHPCTVVAKNDNEGGTATSIDSLQDIDGNWYAVTQIGNQCWMAENLRVTHYETESGDSYIQGGSITPIAYPTSAPANAASFGLLYKGIDATNKTSISAVSDGIQGACPHGWHLPSAAEWNTLNTTIGGSARKLATSCLWNSTLANFTDDRNETGFRAIPLGGSSSTMYYSKAQDAASFWTTTVSSSKLVVRSIYKYGSIQNTEGSFNGTPAYSVRCVRDTVQLPTLSISSDNANPMFCAGEEAVVTYTATLSDASQQNEYSYTWSVRNASNTEYTNFTTNGATCVVTYVKPSQNSNSYNFTVKCTATKGNISMTEEFGESIGNSNVLTGFNMSVDTLTVILVSRAGANDGYSDGISNNCTIEWGDGTSQVGPESTTTSGPQHTYAASGTYDITVYNSDGCPRTRSVTVKTTFETTSPCTGSAHQSIEYQNNGLNGTMNDGYEYSDNGNITAVTDYDGNIYPVVKVGNQCWMKENLRCAHSPQTGTNIVNPLGVSGNTFTSSKRSKVAQWYLNDKDTSVSLRYGLYYNWCAAMDIYSGNEVPESGQTESYWSYTASANHRGVCPKGWHIPTQSELNSLVSSAGSGAALASSSGWNYTFSNASDFTAVPAGEAAAGDFHNSGQMSNGDIDAFFWSATEYSTSNERAYPLRMHNPSLESSGHTSVSTSTDYGQCFKDYGFSVRCVRDAESYGYTPSMSLTASPNDASVTICTNNNNPSPSEAFNVTYTVAIENDDASDYTFAWKINGDTYEGDDAGASSITLHWLSAGVQTVTCTASKGSTVLQESTSISVAVGTFPDLEIGSINGLVVRVDIDPGNNVASIDWGDDTSEDVPSNAGNVSHTYQTAGTYPVTVHSTTGCTETESITVAEAVVTPPTGTYSASAPAGQGIINVTVSDLEFEESGSGTVSVYYSLWTGNNYVPNWQQYGSTSNTIVTGETFNATLNLPEGQYYIKVVLDNGSTTEYESSVSYDVYED